VSALIKSGAADIVRAFPRREVAPQPIAKVAVEVDPRDAECAALRNEVASLERALAELRAASAEAVDKAREEGLAAGAAEAVRREDARVDDLRDGIAAAGQAFEARLGLLENLAPQLARTALDKLFAAPERWSAMVEAALLRQLRALDRSAVLGVRVSPADFPDRAALDALEAALGGRTRIETDADLAAGACGIDCRLGRIDLSVPGQWDALATLLDEMAGEGAA
jgi:flagellar assembly protein FliH